VSLLLIKYKNIKKIKLKKLFFLKKKNWKRKGVAAFGMDWPPPANEGGPGWRVATPLGQAVATSHS
jgi:hypothetical protein